MRTIAALILCLSSVSALANNAGQCYVITDSDYRELCRAKELKERSICYVIKRQDLKAACMAEVSR